MSAKRKEFFLTYDLVHKGSWSRKQLYSSDRAAYTKGGFHTRNIFFITIAVIICLTDSGLCLYEMIDVTTLENAPHRWMSYS